MKLRSWSVMAGVMVVAALALLSMGERNASAAPDSVSGAGGLAAYYFDGSYGTLNLSDGETWVITLTDIDGSGVTGNQAYQLLVQDHGSGSGWETLPTQVHHDFYGAGGHLLQSDDTDWTVRSSHGFNPGDVPGTFDLRVVVTQRGDDKWDVSPYFRLPGGDWTLFYDGSWTTASAFDLTKTRVAVQIDGGGGGTLTFTAPTAVGVDTSTVYVDDDWAGTAPTTEVEPGKYFGINAFATVQGGIDNVSGSTVNVAAGTYNERLTIGKSVDLRGAQYGVDPTPGGARTTPASESTVDLTGLSLQNPNVLVEISDGVSNVSIAGFTLIGSPSFHYADEAVVRAWDNDIAIEDNIIDGYVGILYKGPGHNLDILRNRVTFNKNGVVVQPGATNDVDVSDNVMALGASPGGDEAAIYMTGVTDATVTGNTANDVAPNGRGLYGSNYTQLTASGNTFTGNKDAISIFGSSTFITISDNDLSNSLRHGINIKGQDIDITGNQINDCGDSGINVAKHVLETTGVTVFNNSISGNTNFGLKVDTANVTETVTAERNWWGDATGPAHASNPHGGSAAGDAVTDNVDFVPWYATSTTTPGTENVSTTHNPIIAVSDTMQGAIDAALSGDTVSASAGTYVENVTVDKSLTLAGAGQGSTIVMPAVSNANPCAGSSLCGSGTAASNVILLEASDITVHDLTVDGDNPTLTSGIVRDSADLDARNGIVENYYLGVFDNLEVHHVTVENIYLRGIYPSSGGDNFNIHHNTVQNVQGEDESIAIMGWAGTGVISDNMVSDAIGGIVSNWSRGTQYLNNTVTNSAASLHTDNNGGFGGDPDLLQGNVVSDCQPDGYGVFVFAPFLPATVQENTVNNCAVGLSVERSNGGAAVAPLFEDNEVDGEGLADSVGIYAGTVGFGWGSEDVAGEFTGNIVEHTADGFVIEAEDGYTATVSAVGNSIHDNTSSGATTTGIGTFDVDMTGNWWGDASGPLHTTHNPDGTGNSVGDDIAYSPWLGIGTDASGDPGFQPTSPMTFIVEPEVCLPVGCIQRAVDLASSGDTIRVKEGTYTEDVVVDGKDDLTIEDFGSPKPKVTVPPEATAPIVHVKNASNVTIDGLEIDGAAHGKTGCPSSGGPDTDQRFYGIRYSNASGTVENNEVHGIKHPAGSQGCQSGLGIYAYQSSVQIIGNEVYDYQKNGITANLPGTSNIQGNTVTGSGPLGVPYAAQNGIQAGSDATVTVDGNTVSDNSYTGPGWAATNILVLDADTDVTNNVLSDGYVSLYYVLGSGTINGNTISATTAGVGRPDYWGIAVSDPPDVAPSPFVDAPASGPALPLSPGPGVMHVVVNSNTITGDGSAASTGLEVDSGYYGDEDIDFEAAYNGISDWGYGVVTYACSGTCTAGVFLSVDVGPLNSITDNDVGVGVYNGSSAVEVNFNSIMGNATYGVESDDSVHTLDAENNWWGACTGPTHASNPGGTGDAASDYVDYDPWLHGACDYDHDLLTDDAENDIYSTDWQDPDSDNDGCADGEEVLYTQPTLGGQRDPNNPWDFFDVPLPVGAPGTGTKDQQIDGNDLLAVLSKFGATPGDPDPHFPKYDPAYDRGAPSPHTWTTSAPDGVQDGNDVIWIVLQFGHSCAAPPP